MLLVTDITGQPVGPIMNGQAVETLVFEALTQWTVSKRRRPAMNLRRVAYWKRKDITYRSFESNLNYGQ